MNLEEKTWVPNRHDGSKRITLVERDRRDGSTTSLSIERQGHIKFFHATTGILSANGTKKVYLTMNAEAGGERVFSKVPALVVYQDADKAPGGFTRGHGPLGPGYSYRVKPHINYILEWDKVNEKWFVEVTNDTGAVCDFEVVANNL